MSITFGELRYIVANVSFIFAIMTNVRCSCFSSKVLQKVWAVNDKNMDGTRLMNHSILCATEKRGGGKIMHRAGKMGRKIGAGWKLCIGKRCLQGSLTLLMPRWLTQFQIACVWLKSCKIEDECHFLKHIFSGLWWDWTFTFIHSTPVWTWRGCGKDGHVRD